MSDVKTKLVRDLEIGDRVVLVEPMGVGRVSLKERSRLFQGSGGCWRLDFKVIDGPHKGETIRDQHHPGDCSAEIAP